MLLLSTQEDFTSWVDTLENECAMLIASDELGFESAADGAARMGWEVRLLRGNLIKHLTPLLGFTPLPSIVTVRRVFNSVMPVRDARGGSTKEVLSALTSWSMSSGVVVLPECEEGHCDNEGLGNSGSSQHGTATNHPHGHDHAAPPVAGHSHGHDHAAPPVSGHSHGHDHAAPPVSGHSHGHDHAAPAAECCSEHSHGHDHAAPPVAGHSHGHDHEAAAPPLAISIPCDVCHLTHCEGACEALPCLVCHLVHGEGDCASVPCAVCHLVHGGECFPSVAGKALH